MYSNFLRFSNNGSFFDRFKACTRKRGDYVTRIVIGHDVDALIIIIQSNLIRMNSNLPHESKEGYMGLIINHLITDWASVPLDRVTESASNFFSYIGMETLSGILESLILS